MMIPPYEIHIKITGSGLIVAGILAFALGSVLLHGSLNDGSKVWAAEPDSKADAAKEVRARAFVLVDAAGKERGRLSVTAEDTGLVLKDIKGKDRLKITLAEDGAVSLTAFDPKGVERLQLGNKGNQSVWSLVARDEAGKDRATFGFGFNPEEGAGLGLYAPNGRCRLGIGVTSAGNGGMSLFDEKGKERVGIGMIPSGAGGMVCKGEDGQELWRVP